MAEPAQTWVLASPWPERPGWLTLGEPRAELATRHVGEVPAVLAAVEEALARGGFAVGFVAYEAAAAFDPALVTHRHCPLPRVLFRIYDDCEVTPAPPPSLRRARIGGLKATLSESDYGARLARIRAWIAAGDTYQVNLTFPLRARFEGDAYSLAHHLWAVQTPCYGAYLDLGDQVICSASPELFYALDGDRVTCRPMKGTRPRGRFGAEDDLLAAELASAEKDRAENLMILDMVRNDLGRIARTGSVAVPAMFEVERYPTVWQMTSTVTAETSAPPSAIFAALFPCASVTGAPKVRTMALIHELEPEPRGVYCGALGVLGPGRRALFSVAIRTAVVDRSAGKVRYDVGSGIVWDSRPATEWAECRTKARVVVEDAPRFDLLETLLWEPGGGWLLRERHLSRLAASAAYFGFPCDLAQVEQRLDLAAADLRRPTRGRLTLSADGYLDLDLSPAPPTPDRLWRLAPAAQPVRSDDRFLFHKTTRRQLYEDARATRPECDDVILWNERGEVTETTLGNLVYLRDGRLWTPPLRCGLLPGVYRSLLLDRGWVGDRVLPLAELDQVQGLWVVNSVRRMVEGEVG